MARHQKPTQDETILVNKLTVKDAVHLVKCEGGALSKGRILYRVVTVLIIAAFTARAIVLGQAGAWHLFLPMLAEYLVLLVSLPVIALILHDKDLRRDSRISLGWLIGLILATSIWIASQASGSGAPWLTQGKVEFTRLYDWITTHQMHWPILGAALAMIFSFPSRIAAFHRHGPPFVAVGMGCAMRVVIPLLGCFLLPFIAAGKIPVVWILWTILLLAELGALYMHWDLQKRLERRGIEV